MKTALIVPTALAVLFGCALALTPADATPPATPPQSAGKADPPIVVVGGSAPNVQDLCWVLFHEKSKDRDGKGYDRYALCLYKAANNGRMLHFVDVRELTYDFKAAQLNLKGRADTSPREMKKMWDRATKEREEKETGKRPRNR